MEKPILVIDSNIILAAMQKPSANQQIIFSKKLELITPAYCIEETEKYLPRFAKLLGKQIEEARLILWLIFSEIKIIEEKEYKIFKEDAVELLEDKDDWPFLALAMSKHCSIWSNDRAFKKQQRIKIFNSFELIEKLNNLPE